MTDILLLLPATHAAIIPIKTLLENVPKFNVTTPVPPKKQALLKLHKFNLTAVTNYLCKNNLPIPNNIEILLQDPQSLKSLSNIKCETLSRNHPFSQLQKILNQFNLVIVPADKTKILVILPEHLLLDELNLHISDCNTYTRLSHTEHQKYVKIQKEIVTEAMLFYNKPSLIVTQPSMRYIYFLPKIHKTLSEWRVKFLHPKMRPIVSDTNSITFLLSKHLLPQLQVVEKLFTSSVPSSLAVCKDIDDVNRQLPNVCSPIMATMDVESLFTNICQLRLLDIINSLLIQQRLDDKQRHQLIKCLNIIVRFNTFQIRDEFCLQKIGLPMGGVLSGCLANIYLGQLEKKLLIFPNLLLYNRYMDDIFIIGLFSTGRLERFVSQLRSSFKLTITCSQNHHSVNFLDITIIFSKLYNQFFTYPYSKKQPMYPIPSILASHNISIDKRIIFSQILRTWRISSHNKEFTRGINTYLQFLLDSSPYHEKLRKLIFNFLLPIKLSTHLWTVDIPLCLDCQSILKVVKINITKILQVHGKYVCIKQPINCQTSPIHIVVETSGYFHLLLISSIHSILQISITSTSFHNCNILPLGLLKYQQMIQFIKKHPAVNSNQNIQEKNKYPCALFKLFSNNFYGIGTTNKKPCCVESFFNKHKRLSRLK